MKPQVIGVVMTYKEYRGLVKTYKQKAKAKYLALKKTRQERKGLSFTERRELRKKDRLVVARWKQRIVKVEDPRERRAQRKGYRYFRRLQRRKYVVTIWVIVILIPVTLFTWWYIVATRPLTDEQQSARQTSLLLARQVQEEGMVLLKNENQTLPLKTMKVNVFGTGAVTPIYGGGGAGGIAPNAVDSLYDSLSDAGITYNPALYNLYGNYAKDKKVSTDTYTPAGKTLLDTLLPSISSFVAPTPKEMPYSNVSPEILSQAREYSDTAVYVVSRAGMETVDFSAEQLRLTDDERATLEGMNRTFAHIIVLVNTTNAFELGFVDELPHIDSVLWVGGPGETGSHAIADVLKGSANPSGHLTDTYAYDLSSNPAVSNTGNFQYVDADGNAVRRYFQNNLEGVYVGYRYYETFVDDAVYDQVVQYPFGYGLSYSTFDWSLVSSQVSDGTVTATVSVTNTGERAGKDVVQLYYSAPFVSQGIEKPAVELGGYAKTKTLQPGESQQVTISFATDSMASYDDRDAKAWVLDGGTYRFFVGEDVHHPVAAFTHVQSERKVINKDAVTGHPITNRFDDARGDLTYLSRSHPSSTMPVAPTAEQLKLPEAVKNSDYEHQASNGAEPTTKAQYDIKLEDLKGLSYDDPKWQQFLDQFSEKELVELAGNGGYWSIAIDRLGVPKTRMYDGPASIRSFLGAWATVAYPTPVNLSATWNVDLAETVGRAMGEEAQAFKVDAVYAPSLNLHRSPLGGRNFEYYSEDPLVTGKTGAAYIRGLQSTGTIAVMKHFAGNEQETNRANYGLYVWGTEQSWRELYLRPFEIAVKEGGAHGAMSAFNRVGPTWAGGSRALLTDVLRNEWGFKGFVITDAGIAGQGDHFDALQAVEAGNDLMLGFLIDAPGDNTFEAQLKSYLKQDRAGTLTALRSAAHNICYYVLQTSKF